MPDEDDAVDLVATYAAPDEPWREFVQPDGSISSVPVSRGKNGRMDTLVTTPLPRQRPVKTAASWPAYVERGGKRVWSRGGQAWGQSRAKRDGKGRYLPANGALDAAGAAAAAATQA
jgi:hypothetical protein